MSWKPDRPHGARSGFTLIEVLVVIAIIGTLAAVVGPAVFRNVGDARTNSAKSQVEIFALALNAYQVDNGEFPSGDQGLAALWSAPAGGAPPRNWRGPYLAKIIAPDPWGRPYVYVAPGKVNGHSFDLYTLGRDGAVGGTGEDSDITSWGGEVGR